MTDGREQHMANGEAEIPGEGKNVPWDLVVPATAGMLAIISPFILIVGYSDHLGALGLQNFASEFYYGWTMPILGAFLIFNAIWVRSRNLKIFGFGNIAAGIGLVVLPFMIISHWLYKFNEEDNTMLDIFFNAGDSGWSIYLGGILAIMAGILAILFGLKAFMHSAKEEVPPFQS